MRILFISTGSGDTFYCGNCFRDNLYARALRNAGHDVSIVPLYLPVERAYGKPHSPIFFAATSYFVASKFFGGRNIPAWLKSFFNSPAMLGIASSVSGTTSSKGMEEMTLSMIDGHEPVFSSEMELLLEWIEKYERPDVIHLFTSMIIGLAPELKRRLGIPVVCSVQDEEVWLDTLKERYVPVVWRGIGNRAKYIDRFVTVSETYRNYLLRRIPDLGQVEVVYPGVDPERYDRNTLPEHPTIGYLNRYNPDNGFDTVVEAFILLKRKGSVPGLRLKLGGGYSGSDKRFVRRARRRLKPYTNDVYMEKSYEPADHEGFYSDITILCDPIRFREGIGLYVCEAFAAGRPVVEPAEGSFPEIVADGGLLYEGNTAESLAAAIERILLDRDLYDSCRKNALRLSDERYNSSVSAERLASIYNGVINSG